jgi:hypothetical protein
LLILITAFTLGHSLTLALSTLNILNVKTGLIEFLILVTILITCLNNLKKPKDQIENRFNINYWMAFLFGLIHGLGFSTLLRSLLGESANVLYPLFAFNIGLEAGQLIILACIIVFSVVLTHFLKLRKEKQNLFVSSVVFGIAFILSIQRLIQMIN